MDSILFNLLPNTQTMIVLFTWVNEINNVQTLICLNTTKPQAKKHFERWQKDNPDKAPTSYETCVITGQTDYLFIGDK